MKVIGGVENFWLYSGKEDYEITHPAAPNSPKVYPHMALRTQDSRAIIDPTKTALVVIDLQNYFLSPAFGRPADSLGLQVVERLTKQAISACKKAGILILWLGWGLTDDEIEAMPPEIVRGFSMDTNFEGDLRVWKNRLSGFWGGTNVESVLKTRGIRTLIFAGCNTDQFVAASLTDAVWKIWDCLLLSDGTATTSPKFAREIVEFNMGGWGFSLTSKDLVDGVGTLETGPSDGA